MRIATVDLGAGPVVVSARGDTLVSLPSASTMLALIEGGPRAMDVACADLERGEPIARIDDVNLQWLPPVPVPPSIRDFSVFETHIRQAGAEIARMRGATPEGDSIPQVYRDQPIYYKGNRFSCVGHRHPVRWPTYSKKLDFELEFGIYIRRGGRDIAAKDAAAHIFGYTIFNDVSARDIQGAEMVGQLGPAKGKDFDTGNVMGPWIVTPDELGDAYDLTMAVHVNGAVWATGHTRDMLHTFEEMIASVSRDETLHPGEFFGSGTVGNGCGLELDRWISPGDEVSLHVEGLGTLTNRIG